MKLAAEGEMVQRIDVSASMAAHSDAIGCGTHAARMIEIPMPLGQSKEKWRMVWMMGHPHEVGLREIENLGLPDR